MKKESKVSGQSLVEFTLIIVVSMVLIIGFLDIGRAIFIYSALTNAVREATRKAIVMDYDEYEVDPTSFISNIEQLVDQYAFLIPDPEDNIEVNVLVTEEQIPAVTGRWFHTKISITGTYMFDPITPFIQVFLSEKEGIPINAQSTMRIEPAFR